jgi:hypothetical protein
MHKHLDNIQDTEPKQFYTSTREWEQGMEFYEQRKSGNFPVNAFILYFGGYVTDLPIQTVKVKIILSSGMHL